MRKIRVLIAKPGLDGHDRGALIIAQALRDHGMEVIYTGLRQSPEQIVQTAIQEDVDIVGLSSLSGAHRTLFPKVVEGLKVQGAADIIVIGGGVIPVEDIPFLEEKGIKKIFTSGTNTKHLATYIKTLIQPEETQLKAPKKLAHIGIAVWSIDDSLPVYLDLLRLRLEKVEEVPTEKVKIAFLTLGETRLELLEPTDETSTVFKFLEKNGEGFHHLALEVDDLEKRLKKYKQQGIRLINETPLQGADNSTIAFLHPKATNNLLVELCQHQEGGSE